MAAHEPHPPQEPSQAMNWRQRAACLDTDPELFFPVGTTGPALDQIAQAKAVCRDCPVRAQCLEWSLNTNQDAGVWGSMDEDERRQLRRHRRAHRRDQ
jgi:WhiB family transcriptional regulator, redox-sensing transcriptional regulator